jgi:hypothetical protein
VELLVPAALVGFVVVLVSSSSALAPSSVASSSTPVEWGSSSVIAVAAHDLAVAVVCSVDQTILIWFRIPAIRPSVVVGTSTVSSS